MGEFVAVAYNKVLKCVPGVDINFGK
jgi:hypothetical protein